MPPRRYRVSAAWTANVALGVLSLLPKEDMVRTDLGGHLEHVLAYAATACVVVSAHGTANNPTAYAGSLETLQRFSRGRTPAIADFACSTTGVVLGIAVFALVSPSNDLRRRATHTGSGAHQPTGASHRRTRIATF
jgi:VanZ family protein